MILLKRCRLLFFLLLFNTIGLSAFAQDFFDYHPLQAKGTIPQEFIKLSTEKFESAKGNIKKQGDKKKIAKEKERFYLQVNYALDELMNSGKVLFGDTLTRYVNRVADEILKSDPTLRSKLKFYVVKSEYVNAFATQIGYIFINVGLLAQVENEAQLAFVMCHEIAHYVKEHNLTMHLEKEKIRSGRGDYKRARVHEKLLAIHGFSREIEKEADEYGLTLYNNTPYSRQSLDGVFDVLQYGYLPFDEIPFDSSFFETGYLRFPAEYFPKKINEYSEIEEDEDDTLSTHPSIFKRKEGLTKLLTTSKRTSKAEERPSVLPKEQFEYAQKTARYESGRLLMMHQDYEKAIYNAYLCLKQDEASLFQEKIILKSLYALTQYKNEGSFSTIHLYSRSQEGELHKLVHLFEKLSDEELNGMALCYAWELKNKYHDDKEIPVYANELLRMFVYKHVDNINDLEKEPKKARVALGIATKEEVAEVDPSSVMSPEDYAKLSKYEKIKYKVKRQKDLKKKKKTKKEKTEEDEKPKSFIYYAFVDYLKDSAFTKNFRKYAKLKKEDEVRLEKEQEKKQKLTRRQRKKQQEGDLILARYAEGTEINKLVIVKPVFITVDERKKDLVRISDSEVALKEYTERLKRLSEKVGLDLQIIAPKELKPDQTVAFNDMAFVSEFFQERFAHTGIDSILTFEPARAQELIQRYGTKYFGLSLVVTIREKNNAWLYIPFSILYPPLLPFAIAKSLSSNDRTTFVTLVMDVETGKAVYALSHEVALGARNDVMEQFVYDNLYSIKNLSYKKK